MNLGKKTARKSLYYAFSSEYLGMVQMIDASFWDILGQVHTQHCGMGKCERNWWIKINNEI